MIIQDAVQHFKWGACSFCTFFLVFLCRKSSAAQKKQCCIERTVLHGNSKRFITKREPGHQWKCPSNAKKSEATRTMSSSSRWSRSLLCGVTLNLTRLGRSISHFSMGLVRHNSHFSIGLCAVSHIFPDEFPTESHIFQLSGFTFSLISGTILA